MSSKNARAELAGIISALPKLEANLVILKNAWGSNSDREDAITQQITEAREALDYARRVSAANQVDALLGKVTDAGVSVSDAENAIESAEDELFQVQTLQNEIKSRIEQTEFDLSVQTGKIKSSVGRVLLTSGLVARHMETIERAEADLLQSHQAMRFLIDRGYLTFAELSEHEWSKKVHRHRTSPGAWQESLTTKLHGFETDTQLPALVTSLERDAEVTVPGEIKARGK